MHYLGIVKKDGENWTFNAETEEDMTVKQLIEQSNRIKPDYCACGVCSVPERLMDSPTEIIFDYDDVRKTGEVSPCTIKPKEANDG